MITVGGVTVTPGTLIWWVEGMLQQGGGVGGQPVVQPPPPARALPASASPPMTKAVETSPKLGAARMFGIRAGSAGGGSPGHQAPQTSAKPLSPSRNGAAPGGPARACKPHVLHAHTRALLDGWRNRAAGRRAPGRLELSPLMLGPLRPQMLVLAEAGGAWTVRRSGALWDELFGFPLAEGAFAALWPTRDRPPLLAAQEAARRAGEPGVLQARGETRGGRPAAFELALAPATGPHGAPDRMLVLLQPTTPLARLGGEPLLRLRLAHARAAPVPEPCGPRLVVDNTRPVPLG